MKPGHRTPESPAAMRRIPVLIAAILLSACGQSDESHPAAEETSIPEQVSKQAKPPPHAPEGENIGTPNADRIATLGLLNKRNNITRDLVLKTGESRRAGDVVVKLESCERSLPWEAVKEEGAFVQVFVNQPPKPGQSKEWQTVFSGWLFKNSPSLNVVEHPIYDVWVKACAMSFPGEEGPAPATSAEKASGSESGAAPPE